MHQVGSGQGLAVGNEGWSSKTLVAQERFRYILLRNQVNSKLFNL